MIACMSKPRKFVKGGYEYTETCIAPTRTWTATKNGYSCEQNLCDAHANDLRREGWDLRITLAISPDSSPPKKS